MDNTSNSTAPDLRIDELALDREWLGQPGLYAYWADRLAEAQHALDMAKVRAEIEKATVERDIRTAPDEYGLQKATEASIAATVMLQPEYKISQTRVAEAAKVVAQCRGYVTAIEHRKRALTCLVDLYLGGYYAGTRRATAEPSEQDKAAIRAKGRRRPDEPDSD